ncbi:MAG: ABC transporter permease [Bryobacteraceae bacterium]|jgi:putative ABC transport system permease protein
MESVLQDLRYAMRVLRRSPGFALIAVAALALGIGANTAIFSVVDTVILKPLPYREPAQLVQLWMRFTGIGIPNDQNWVSAPEFMDLQRNTSFSHLAAIAQQSYNVTIGGSPERIDSAVVTPSFFPLLGVQAQVGRVFQPEEGQPGRERVVLLGDGYWRRQFGADPSVTGRKLIMGGQSYLIAGVLPRGFQYPAEADVWTPLVFSADALSESNRGNHGLLVIARIKSGLSFERARAEMAAVSHRIIEQHPGYPYRDFNFAVIMISLLEEQIGDIKTALWVLMAAVGLVLLIACANVANLLLVHASGREREVAVRQALGAGRWRLARQLLTESVILGCAGGLAGLALAYWAVRLLVGLSATNFPRVADSRVDLPVLGFTMLVSVATGILFGLAPAFHFTRQAAYEALKEGARGTSGKSAHRLRGALIVAEVALSLMLLAGSGLLIRSFLRLQEVDTGFRPEGVLTMRVSLPPEKYSKPEQPRTFYRELLDRVRRLPGVDAAGGVTGLPLTGTGWSGTTTIDTQAVPERDRTPEADQRPVLPGYFEAMGIALLRGRYFDQRDIETSAPVAIVDETLARTYWPNQEPLGKRIKQGGRQSQNPWRTIVGVVRHVRYRTLESPSRVEFYWPYAQSPFPVRSMSLAIHAAYDPRMLANAVEREVQALDPDQPVYRVRTMRELMSESVARRRLSMLLLAVFAGVALLLASIGIYGVMSYTVAQRSHEVGIRMALGAGRADVVRLVLGQSLRLTLSGILAGLLGSWSLTRFLSTLLFDTGATDPLTFGAVALILAMVAVAASLIPAWRATVVDPMSALRQE